MYLLNAGGLVHGSKSDFAVAGDDASPKFDLKSPRLTSQKTNGVKRKTVRRIKILKSERWYEKAALSIKISGKTVTNSIQACMNIENKREGAINAE
jgi:hypothetical protein